MSESLSTEQIAHVIELGEWRDKGHCFAVGLHGEVSIHVENEVEIEDEERQQRQRPAGWQGPSRREGSSGSCGTKAETKPSSKERVDTLKRSYLDSLPEVEEFYPSLKIRETEEGIWVIVQSFPLGRDGPRFYLCVYLSYSDNFDPKAFAFAKVSPVPRPVAMRHANFPDASICAYVPEDDVWRPGYSPLILLNLYAEWLICQLFLKLEKRWPGRQFGDGALYRVQQFEPNEWCFCSSKKRYSECHMAVDKGEVAFLKFQGKSAELGYRKIPPEIVRFAKSGWKKVPQQTKLHMHPYKGLPSK